MSDTTVNQLERLAVRCMACGLTASGTSFSTSCSACGGLLDCVIATDGVTRDSLSAGASKRLLRSGVWKYRALLPAIPDASVVTRYEGNTPIYSTTGSPITPASLRSD